MNISSIELPSNRKFGFFFTGVFFAASAYFYFEENATSPYVFAAFGTLLLFATVIKTDFSFLSHKQAPIVYTVSHILRVLAGVVLAFHAVTVRCPSRIIYWV